MNKKFSDMTYEQKMIAEAAARRCKFITEYNSAKGGQMEELVNEGLNRIEQWINTTEIAIMSAWRDKLVNVTPNTYIDREVGNPDDEEDRTGYFSKKEKKERNSELKSTLIYSDLGYGVTEVLGSYIEGYSPKENKGKEIKEESFFIVNKDNKPNFKENIFKLAEYYNQDSFIYKHVNSNAILVGTNSGEHPAKGGDLGDFIKDCAMQFMTKIGNKGFVFGHSDEVTDAKPTSFNDRKYNRIYNQTYNKKYPNDPNHVEPTYNPYTLAKYTNKMIEQRLLASYEKLGINAKRVCQIRAKTVINESGCKIS